jgi:hypothetical protein
LATNKNSKKKKKKKKNVNLWPNVGGEGGGQQRENGQAAWAPQPPPCVLAGSSQSGRAAKKGKEGRKTLFSLSLSLSLSPVVARDLSSSVLFVLFC